MLTMRTSYSVGRYVWVKHAKYSVFLANLSGIQKLHLFIHSSSRSNNSALHCPSPKAVRRVHTSIFADVLRLGVTSSFSLSLSLSDRDDNSRLCCTFYDCALSLPRADNGPIHHPALARSGVTLKS
jgi:hypothetical protein